MTIYSDALGKQTTFNNALLSKLQELATAVGNRVRSADLYDGNGKIKSNLLPFAINDLLEMKGALDLQAESNQITSGSGSKDGEIYIVTQAATGLTIDDITEVKIGDWVLFIDGKWVRMPFGDQALTTGLVSFNGRTASNVVPTAGDYDAAKITLSNALSTLALTASDDVQTALAAIDTMLGDINGFITSQGTAFDQTATAIAAITVVA